MSKIGIAHVALILAFGASTSQLACASTTDARVVAGWKDRLQKADIQLRASQWREGAVTATTVMREMRDHIVRGSGTASLLGLSLLLRAVGESGLGYATEAAWDFGAAQALFPEYQAVDLAPYGKAGAALEPWRYNGSTPANPEFMPTDLTGLGIVPPRKVKGNAPSYPRAKADACVYGPIVVRAVINEVGRLEFPSLQSRADPVLALAAFDGLRNWEFVPAQLDGKPVRAFFTLTVNFELPVCR